MVEYANNRINVNTLLKWYYGDIRVDVVLENSSTSNQPTQNVNASSIQTLAQMIFFTVISIRAIKHAS
jgi:hypothetical protein